MITYTIILKKRDRRDRMVVGCEFEPRSWRGVPDTTLCDKSLSVTCERSVVFPTNKTDRHDITEILLKVALNTIKQTNKKPTTPI